MVSGGGHTQPEGEHGGGCTRGVGVQEPCGLCLGGRGDFLEEAACKRGMWWLSGLARFAG